MNPRIPAALVALALTGFATLTTAAAPRECQIRALSLSAGATADIIHAHSVTGAATVGSIRVKTFLNHENDTLKAFCRRDGEWQSVASGAWPDPGDKRALQILTDNPVTKQVEIRGVRDVAKPGQ